MGGGNDLICAGFAPASPIFGLECGLVVSQFVNELIVVGMTAKDTNSESKVTHTLLPRLEAGNVEIELWEAGDKIVLVLIPEEEEL